MTWSQRSFFMKQVFDQDNDLRFVKAQQRPKYKPNRFEWRQNSADVEEVIDLAAAANVIDIENEGGKDGEPLLPRSRPSSATAQGDIALPPIDKPVIPPEEKIVPVDPREQWHKLKRSVSLRDNVMLGTVRSKANDTDEKTSDDTIPEIKEEGDDSEAQEDIQDLLSPPTPLPSKTKFPVLKIKALGIFAAAFKKKQADNNSRTEPLSLPKTGRESVSLPSSPVTNRRVNPLSKSLEDRPKSAQKVESPSGLYTVNEMKSMSIKRKSLPMSTSPEHDKSYSIKSPIINAKSQGAVQRRESNAITQKLSDVPEASSVAAVKKRNSPKHKNNTARSKTRENDPITSATVTAVTSYTVAPSKPQTANENHVPKTSSVSSKTSAKTRPLKTRGGAKDQRKPNNIWQRVTEEPEPTSRKWNKDGTCKHTHSSDTNTNNGMQLIDIEGELDDLDYIDEKILRRLVHTLPTELQIKTHRREAEAKGSSVEEVRRKMIENAKYRMSRRVVLDPRFKQLEKSLSGVP